MDIDNDTDIDLKNQDFIDEISVGEISLPEEYSIILERVDDEYITR